MNKPKIFRKRYIPDEIIDISNDEVLYRDDKLLVTRWKAIRPRKDFSDGQSFTFLNEGIKISKFYDASGSLLYWYCDIIDVKYDRHMDSYELIDLLIDVKIMPDGRMTILDADELAEALEKGLVSNDQACRCLRRLDGLLKAVYNGSFPPEICKNDEL